ncbi:FlxA-like family protein [Pseudomonas viridiflava]|uniref:FlxA-like family protein n=1 Tax=Pseudomonas viridiflava TaxID=33069 RepID=UPI001C31B4B2|nr:FlxA-like family protein [Pseudomonas viridiflava]QXG36295.1 FlxA-like family protein [Pseudomonas viridiflava]
MTITTSPVGGITLTTPKSQITYRPQEAVAEVSATPAEGIKVDLSAEGRAAASSSSKDADIEQSGLPKSVQKLLKAIRELQRQITELTVQIQQVLTDPRLSDDERKSKAAGLQAVLSMLQAQISTSSDDLSSLMNQLKSSNDEKTQAGMLILAKM